MATTIARQIQEALQKRTETVLRSPSVPVNNLEAQEIAAKVANEIAPVVVNATNSEPFYRSRVTIGSTIGVLAAIYGLLNMISSGNFDADLAGGFIATLIGAGFSLWARIRGGRIGPLFERLISRR